MKNKISFIISDITNKGGTERVTALLSNILSSNIENAEVEIFSLQKNMPILSISYQIKSLLNMEMDGAIILYCPI
ncbi:hypothetical protein ECZU23_07480 [Escherichia coli]|uniref:hypothetical protein n=1 Tax=Escherichia coli TaxID=562 RepID=UPI001A13E5DA|nr:hypothetical protein [Escherichia coli]MBW8950855.1 hypothetical protein [Escherichia coli]GHL12305.1 hypothetical protein ECZU23_07480 [Escherichia coli]